MIVCRDRIIARAHNLTETLTDVTAHAEMQAITAAANLLGAVYKPVYVLSSQAVSGTNYCVLARAETVAPGAEAYYTFATVYKDLSGNVEITEFRDLDIGALYGEAAE